MLNMLKDPAKRAEWVYGQPMAPCPACGNYDMKPHMPIVVDLTGIETLPQLAGKWARAIKAGATSLQGPAVNRPEETPFFITGSYEVSPP